MPASPESSDDTLPLHLTLAERRVVVVGGGPVAARKISSCLAARALVLVVAPVLDPCIAERVRAGHVQWRPRNYRSGDLDGAWLVFTATGVVQVDRQVEHDASRNTTFCVRADDAKSGTARSPAVLRRDGMVISVGTGAVRSPSSTAADPQRAVAARDAIAQALDNGSLRLPSPHQDRTLSR